MKHCYYLKYWLVVDSRRRTYYHWPTEIFTHSFSTLNIISLTNQHTLFFGQYLRRLPRQGFYILLQWPVPRRFTVSLTHESLSVVLTPGPGEPRPFSNTTDVNERLIMRLLPSLMIHSTESGVFKQGRNLTQAARGCSRTGIENGGTSWCSIEQTNYFRINVFHAEISL